MARFPSHTDDVPLPPIDENIVEPGSRWEILDGERLYVAPAEPPHAEAHSQLGFVVRGLAAPGYKAVIDMLTRTGHKSNFAPDASIFPAERDPVTGGRKIEEMAFEVVSEQAISVPTRKARELVRRGVRRVFCILVEERQVREWSREADGWVDLPQDAEITDGCLSRSLPVRALVDAAMADNAVAQALVEKKNPVIEQIEAKGEAKGEAKALVAFLEAREIAVSSDIRARILATQDLERLERWVRKAATVDNVEELFDDGTSPSRKFGTNSGHT